MLMGLWLNFDLLLVPQKLQHLQDSSPEDQDVGLTVNAQLIVDEVCLMTDRFMTGCCDMTCAPTADHVDVTSADYPSMKTSLNTLDLLFLEPQPCPRCHASGTKTANKNNPQNVQRLL